MHISEVVISRGELPEWAEAFDGYGDGDGDGYGYGYGSGSGSGSGSGDGSGDGSGYGYGSGYGSGYGYGDGYGYGYGSGSGSGYGYGDGYGDGSGYGSGYGYGSPSYWLSAFKASVLQWTSEQRERLAELFKSAAVIAFWKSDSKGHASNGGKTKEAAQAGLVTEIQGPLNICTAKALHATMQPEKWQGERLWVVALFGEVAWQDDKCAALKREIIGEVK